MSLIWLIAFVVFLVVEGVTTSLTSIWFAGGSLAALVVQVCGRRSVSPAGSVCGSVLHVVSYGPSICLQVPVRQADKTNVDSLTGRKAVVRTELIMWQVQEQPSWPVRPGLPGRQRRGYL